MPRRLLREGILESHPVNRLSDSAEILYRRLMSVVDDYGRYEADIDIIRARCFPLQLDRWPPARVAHYLYEISGGSPLVTVENGGSTLVTVENGGSPLVTVYRSGEKVYLQVNNFGQRIQSKAKFPAPSASANETISQPSVSEAPRISPPLNGHSSSPSWSLDESYVPFAELSRKLWPQILDEELTEGHRFYWSKLSFEQRMEAIKNIQARVDADEDGKYVTLMDVLQKAGVIVNDNSSHFNGWKHHAPCVFVADDEEKVEIRIRKGNFPLASVEWISCEDRLPPMEATVMVVRYDGSLDFKRRVEIRGTRDGNAFVDWWWGNGGTPKDNIKYWSVSPDAPRNIQNKELR